MSLILVTDTNPGVARWDDGSIVVSENSSWKAPVDLATTGPIVLSPAPVSIDGIPVLAGYRILVKDQADPKQNGIYEKLLGTPGLTRTSDFAAGTTEQAGVKVYVRQGVLNGTETFVFYSPVTEITVGVGQNLWESDGAEGGTESVSTATNINASTSVVLIDTTPNGAFPIYLPAITATTREITIIHVAGTEPAEIRPSNDVDGVGAPYGYLTINPGQALTVVSVESTLTYRVIGAA